MVASLYAVEEAQQAIWVYLEQEAGRLESVTKELLVKGRELADQNGWPLVGLLLGSGVSHLAGEAIGHRVDEVLVADHPLLEFFAVEAYTHVVFDILAARKPSVLLFGATPNGRDLAGRLAVRLRTGLNADCIDLKLSTETGILVSEVSGFGGGVLALIEMPRHRPQMATVRPGVFRAREPDACWTAKTVNVPVQLSAEVIRSRIKRQEMGKGPDLTQTDVLVAGGRGIAGDFAMLRELAGLLDGDVGATRPPVDEGHIERERQIGQTGVICRPKVAIVCGISGAFHFVVGIQDAGTVIAINADPEAAIFDFADYCIVGDAQRIVPALIRALREMSDSPEQAASAVNTQTYPEISYA